MNTYNHLEDPIPLELQKKLERNVEDRKQAEEIFREISDLVGEQSDHFWKVLADLINVKMAPKQQQEPITKQKAMSDRMAKAFEESLMPWGKYKGKPIGEVPTEYLVFFVEEDRFKERLARYIKSNVFKDRQRDD